MARRCFIFLSVPSCRFFSDGFLTSSRGPATIFILNLALRVCVFSRTDVSGPTYFTAAARFSDGFLTSSRGPPTVFIFNLAVCVCVFEDRCEWADIFQCCGTHWWGPVLFVRFCVSKRIIHQKGAQNEVTRSATSSTCDTDSDYGKLLYGQ